MLLVVYLGLPWASTSTQNGLTRSDVFGVGARFVVLVVMLLASAASDVYEGLIYLLSWRLGEDFELPRRPAEKTASPS